MTYRFNCDHCGKSFQLETPEAKECPFCFWASSIRREDIAAAEKQVFSAGQSKKTSPSGPDGKQIFSGLMFLLKIAFFLALLAGVVFLGYQLYTKWKAEPKNSKGDISISTRDIGGAQEPAGDAGSRIASLSSAEKKLLSQEVTLPETIEPAPEENQILKRTVEFKTGWSEKLPSTIWTFEQYQQMIKEQEQFYKMPFARSYKKKLEELFKTTYIPAGEAFAKGDLLRARDLWAGSLALPLYSNDLLKHRAVALTMLKPFINDTLAKIGVLNQNLVVKERRIKEQALTREYQGLSDLINAKKWTEAVRAVDQLKPMLDQLDALAKQQAAPPPYPASIATIDQDVQRPLADLLATNPVPVVNLLNLRQDLAEKRDILAGLTDEQVKASVETYRNALAMVQEQQWQDALNGFSSIHSPGILRDDARAKAAVLQKIVPENLNSSAQAN